MDVSHEADLASVRRILEGDEAVFIELVRRLQRPLLRLAEVYVGKGPAAEEIVQEAWVGFIDGLERFEKQRVAAAARRMNHALDLALTPGNQRHDEPVVANRNELFLENAVSLVLP